MTHFRWVLNTTLGIMVTLLVLLSWVLLVRLAVLGYQSVWKYPLWWIGPVAAIPVGATLWWKWAERHLEIREWRESLPEWSISKPEYLVDLPPHNPHIDFDSLSPQERFIADMGGLVDCLCTGCGLCDECDRGNHHILGADDDLG